MEFVNSEVFLSENNISNVFFLFCSCQYPRIRESAATGSSAEECNLMMATGKHYFSANYYTVVILCIIILHCIRLSRCR